MADIDQVVRDTAPMIEELDLQAVRARVEEVRQEDLRRARIRFGGIAVVLVLEVSVGTFSLLRPTSAGVAVGNDPVVVPTGTPEVFAPAFSTSSPIPPLPGRRTIR